MTSRLPLKQDPVIDCVPIELIEAFGRYLDGPSILASLQVCQRWHQVLRPLIWTSINKFQFYHPQFPLHSECTPEDIVALQTDLFQVRHIEWSCKIAINDDRRWQGPRMSTMPLPQLSTDKMALIFTYTPNLQTLTLDLRELDTYFLCLEALKPRTLRRLDIEASRAELVALDRIFPLLSGLEELRLAGSISSWTALISQDRLPPPETIWKLTRLHIHYLDTTLVQYCPELRELELYWPETDNTVDSPALREILTCTELEALMFTPFNRFPPLKDLPELLRCLRGLKRLSFSAYSIEEVEFLYGLDEHATQQAEQMTAQATEGSANGPGSWHGHQHRALVLPLLEHLSITIEDLPMDVNNSGRLYLSLGLILGSRPALKTIVVRKFECDPRGLSMERWACRGLETLSLEFSWTLSILSDKERVGLWRHVYRQIGSLTKLKSLMLWCAGMEMGIDSGVEALAGASGLERLALADELSVTWSREKLWKLLQIFPKLTTLCLDPLENSEEVSIWLQEFERPIELISYDAMRLLVRMESFAQ